MGDETKLTGSVGGMQVVSKCVYAHAGLGIDARATKHAMAVVELSEGNMYIVNDRYRVSNGGVSKCNNFDSSCHGDKDTK